MSVFEDIVSLFLQGKGYWVRQSVKVNISKEDKKYIGTFSMPRPEIDLVALSVRDNELLLVEAKSFLDSPGVRFSGVSGKDPKDAEHYKLFTKKKLREVVTRQLREEYLNRGLIKQDTKINYALAAGHIYWGDEPKIVEYFSRQGWKLFTPKQIKEEISQLSQKGWEDNLVTMTAKLIRRGE